MTVAGVVTAAVVVAARLTPHAAGAAGAAGGGVADATHTSMDALLCAGFELPAALQELDTALSATGQVTTPSLLATSGGPAAAGAGSAGKHSTSAAAAPTSATATAASAVVASADAARVLAARSCLVAGAILTALCNTEMLVLQVC